MKNNTKRFMHNIKFKRDSIILYKKIEANNIKNES